MPVTNFTTRARAIGSQKRFAAAKYFFFWAIQPEGSDTTGRRAGGGEGGVKPSAGPVGVRTSCHRMRASPQNMLHLNTIFLCQAYEVGPRREISRSGCSARGSRRENKPSRVEKMTASTYCLWSISSDSATSR